jgi:hypothetical protein
VITQCKYSGGSERIEATDASAGAIVRSASRLATVGRPAAGRRKINAACAAARPARRRW